MNSEQRSPLIGEARAREILETGTRYVYRNLPEGDLSAHFVFPPDFNHESDRRAAIVFLHGGRWDISAPNQFMPHAHHFASRGMVAISAEYRTRDKFGGGPLESMEDAKELMLFIRRFAHELGIDASRIVLSGASSGGHAALCATVHQEEEETLSHRPNALILYSPVSNTGWRGHEVAVNLFPSQKLARATNPLSHLPQKNLPPCLIFHGTADRMVPYDQSVKLKKRYQKKRNACELMEFTGAGHTFFNFNTGDQNYELTLKAADLFLVEKGILPPDPYADLVI